jgi:DNA-binding Lrp family transcriptional regulator
LLENKEMAGKTISMNQIRQIIQNRIKGISNRKISERLGLSRNTLKIYLRRLESNQMSMDELLGLSNSELGIICYGDTDTAQPAHDRYAYFQSKLKEWAAELTNPKVTRQLLWEEYRTTQSEGYGYSQFCYYINEYLKQKQVSAIFHHQPSEKIMIDFAGSFLEYIDANSGEIIPCPVFISLLPYSHLIYCEALPSQQQPDFVQGFCASLNYLGGVPQCILVDNMKTAVKRANRYEPKFTELVEQLSVHYQTTFMATRVRKPKDYVNKNIM